MGKRLAIAALSVGTVLATALMLGCEGGMTDPESGELAPIQVAAYAVGAPVSTIVIEVTAADIKNRLSLGELMLNAVYSYSSVHVYRSDALECPGETGRYREASALVLRCNPDESGLFRNSDLYFPVCGIKRPPPPAGDIPVCTCRIECICRC